jgi:hypothetical protein
MKNFGDSRERSRRHDSPMSLIPFAAAARLRIVEISLGRARLPTGLTILTKISTWLGLEGRAGPMSLPSRGSAVPLVPRFVTEIRSHGPADLCVSPCSHYRPRLGERFCVIRS